MGSFLLCLTLRCNCPKALFEVSHQSDKQLQNLLIFFKEKIYGSGHMQTGAFEARLISCEELQTHLDMHKMELVNFQFLTFKLLLCPATMNQSICSLF